MTPLDPEVLARIKEQLGEGRITTIELLALLDSYEQACMENERLKARNFKIEQQADFDAENIYRERIASLRADVARLRAQLDGFADGACRAVRDVVAANGWDENYLLEIDREIAALAQTSPSASQTSSDEWLARHDNALIERCCAAIVGAKSGVIAIERLEALKSDAPKASGRPRNST